MDGKPVDRVNSEYILDFNTRTSVISEGGSVCMELQMDEWPAEADCIEVQGYGNVWEWTDNMTKVEEGLFKLEILWEGTGFNVKSDDNPIKKDWYWRGASGSRFRPDR